MRFPAISAFVFCIASLAAAQSTAHWDYFGKDGPLRWGKLDPAYKACSEGHEQSPIDIRKARLNKGLRPIEFHYLAGPITEENTGHTVVMHVVPGSYIVLDGVRYDLIQFHFHHPSETTVQGKYTDLEAHLVHKSADGKLAVIAIRFGQDAGGANAVIASLWPYLPQKVGGIEKTTEMVDPAGLLPGDRGYWTYTGSLTAPPCTEGVRWFVYEEELSVSRGQLSTYSALYKMNARPPQDAHGRRIEANE